MYLVKRFNRYFLNTEMRLQRYVRIHIIRYTWLKGNIPIMTFFLSSSNFSEITNVL